MTGRRPARTTLALCVSAALLLAGCGNSDDAARPPTASTPSAVQIERAASATRRAHIDEIVSEYLSELRDSPAAVGSPRVQSVTGNQLSAEVADAPAACGETVIKLIGVIARKNLSARSRAKRITTAMDAVHARC